MLKLLRYRAPTRGACVARSQRGKLSQEKSPPWKRCACVRCASASGASLC